MQEKLLIFWNKFDFAALMDSILSGAFLPYLLNPVAYAIIGLILILIGIKKTRFIGVKMATWLGILIIYGIGGVVLKNSHINEIGPFILALSLFFGVIGYQIWTKLIRG